MTSAKSFGLVVTGTSGGQELVLCPFHPDRHSSAWWNPRKDLFYCAVCGFGCNAQQLANRLGIEYEEVIEWDVAPDDFDLVDEVRNWDMGEAIYHDYFRERGVHESVIGEYGVRWSNNQPRAAVIPLTNLKGEVEGLQYRYQDVSKTGTRYRTHGKVPPVWPMHKLKHLHSGCPILLFEGVWSAMRVATFLLKHPHIKLPTFALLGAKANEEIVETLKPFTPVYLYDMDEAGKRACHKMRALDELAPSYVTESPDDMEDVHIKQMMGFVLVKLAERRRLPAEEIT